MPSRISLPPPPPVRRASPRESEHFVQLDAQGKLHAGHGQTEPLATVTAYACNVADAVGRLLQLGAFTSARASLGRTSLLVQRDESGHALGSCDNSLRSKR